MHRLFGPQTLPAGQVVGQGKGLPQPSPMLPQYCSLLARLHEVMVGTQVEGNSQMCEVALQTFPPLQVLLQVTARPQLSAKVPQYCWLPMASLQDRPTQLA